MTRRISWLLASAFVLPGFAATTARADSIVETYAAPTVEDISSTICTGTSGANGCVYGVETFDAQPTGAGTGFSDTFAGGVITATYSGDYQINPADVYGGAGGTGNYIATFSTGGYTVNLSNTSAIPGINYFGMWLSALDLGNDLTFYNGSTVVGTYTPNDLINAVGSCTGANPYCGNPSTKFGTNNQQYVFISFFDTTGYFTSINFSENPEVGGYESDNHTFGYRNPNDPFGNGVPEPASLGMLAVGVAGALVARHRRKAASA